MHSLFVAIVLLSSVEEVAVSLELLLPSVLQKLITLRFIIVLHEFDFLCGFYGVTGTASTRLVSRRIGVGGVLVWASRVLGSSIDDLSRSSFDSSTSLAPAEPPALRVVPYEISLFLRFW